MILSFTKIEKGHGYSTLTSAQQRTTNALEDDYETNGEATHIAHTELGEQVFVYPPEADGDRLVLVLSAGADYVSDPFNCCPSEFYVAYTDDELESGVEVHTSLF